MAATDWEITGKYDIVLVEGSHRFRGWGNMDAKWKGRDDLEDCRVQLSMFFNSQSQGGPFLRFDSDLKRGYYLQTRQQSSDKAYIWVYRYENSIGTLIYSMLDDHYTPSPYTIRFSVCGSLFNIDVFDSGSWITIANFTNENPIASGCVGFRSRHSSDNYRIGFDDIKIEEKV